MRQLQARDRPASAACLVGPEGGWTPEEREAALAAGCLPVTLGALTLRADAVAPRCARCVECGLGRSEAVANW